MTTQHEETIAYSRTVPHDIRVQVLCTADEYLFAKDESSKLGISQSSYMRDLLNRERRKLAQEQLSAETRKENTQDAPQELHNLIKSLVKLVKAEMS